MNNIHTEPCSVLNFYVKRNIEINFKMLGEALSMVCFTHYI